MPQKNKLAKPKPGPSTQRYLDISEIRDDVVVMKDGTLRGVLLVSSINFALKSEDEQNAIISAYVGFINAFEYPVQIVIQSRRLNIDDYIDRLRKIEATQTNELLRVQTRDYLNYIQELVALGAIMSKKFFVVVPYNPLSDKAKGFRQRFAEVLSPVKILRLEDKRFTQRKKDLMERVGQVESSLGSMGLNSTMLDTQGLIELYYTSYNPEIKDTQKLADLRKMQVE